MILLAEHIPTARRNVYLYSFLYTLFLFEIQKETKRTDTLL